MMVDREKYPTIPQGIVSDIKMEGYWIGRAIGLAEGGWDTDCVELMKKHLDIFKPLLDWIDKMMKQSSGRPYFDESKYYLQKPLLRLAVLKGLSVPCYYCNHIHVLTNGEESTCAQYNGIETCICIMRM